MAVSSKGARWHGALAALMFLVAAASRASDLPLESWDADEVRAADRSLRVPLVVVSAGRQCPEGKSKETRAEMRRLWDEMQSELAALSPQGRRVVARKSGHYVQRDEPAIIIDAIVDVVRAIRGGNAGP